MVETGFRLLLAGVLGYAALAKLSAPRASLAGLATYGFPDNSLRPVAWASLVAVELALAIGVALDDAAAAYAAAALMALFAALEVGQLLRGRAGAPCACFGPQSTISWLGLARDAALAAGFALIPSLGSISVGAQGWLGIAVAVALIACAILGASVLALAREVGMLRLKLGTQGALEIEGEGPEVGSRAADLARRLAVNGAPLGSAGSSLGLAVFTSEGCHICQTLTPAIENVAKDPRVAVGVFDEVAEAELWRSLEVPGSPFAVALDAEGTVLAKGTFNNLAQLESVLATAERRA
jgi:methylamine utilization protein MauE